MESHTGAAISVENLSVRYPGSDVPVLERASVEIEAGEFVAVVGANGSGKTTLCKSFNGLVPHFYDGSFDGTVTVAGLDTREASVSQLSRVVGYVFQEFDNQLVSPTVFDEVAFGPINHGLEEYRERVVRSLSLVGLDGLEDRFLWELSGGQKHLVALASVLALDPSVLVVDEPAAQLDPSHAADTYTHLAALNRDHGTTVVTIEHRTEFVAEYCDSVVLVEDGHVAWKAPVETALNRLAALRANDIRPPQVTSTAARLRDGDGPVPVTLEQGIRWFESNCSLDARPPSSTTDGESTDGASASDDEPPHRERTVSISSVTQSYTTLRGSDERVLDELSLDLYAGDRVAIVGPNGAGKSTLLRLVAGIESPDSGRITVHDTDTSSVLPETIAEDVAYVHQNPETMFVTDSVRDDIAHYLHSRGLSDSTDRVEEIVSLLDLEAIADRDGRLLSVGQQRRATLAIGLAIAPSILLLDEPTGSLDLASRADVGRIISHAGDRVPTVVMATHDLDLVAEWATRVIVLDDGSVLADDTPSSVFGSPDLLATAQLSPPQVVRVSTALELSPIALTSAELVERLSGDRSRPVTESGVPDR